MKSSFGEIFIAFLMAGAAAVLAAGMGFVGAIFLCAKLLSGEGSESALILAPATALILGIAVFVFVFGKVIRYGEDLDSPR
jgi:hypothetical protein